MRLLLLLLLAYAPHQKKRISEPSPIIPTIKGSGPSTWVRPGDIVVSQATPAKATQPNFPYSESSIYRGHCSLPL